MIDAQKVAAVHVRVRCIMMASGNWTLDEVDRHAPKLAEELIAIFADDEPAIDCSACGAVPGERCRPGCTANVVPSEDSVSDSGGSK